MLCVLNRNCEELQQGLTSDSKAEALLRCVSSLTAMICLASSARRCWLHEEVQKLKMKKIQFLECEREKLRHKIGVCCIQVVQAARVSNDQKERQEQAE